MKIGFIGVGGVAQPHLQNVSKIKGVKIQAVCDVLADRAHKAAETYSAQPYTDYRDMLRAEDLDACYVCVIPAAHAHIELDLAKARIPFYVEKPVHLDLNVCQKVIEELARTGTITCVGYHWRYTKASVAVKRWVERRRISLVEGWWYSGMPGVAWWRQMKLSGGQLVEQTTHIIDMARYLAGEVHTVVAAGTTGALTDVSEYDIHDASVCTLMFDSGAIGQVTSGCIAGQNGDPNIGISVKGHDWFAWTDAGKARLSDAKGLKEIDSGQNWQEQLGNGDRAFTNAVKRGDSSRILSPYVSGVQTLAITLAANQSARTGRPVKVQRFV